MQVLNYAEEKIIIFISRQHFSQQAFSTSQIDLASFHGLIALCSISTNWPAQIDGDRSLTSFHGSISVRSIHGKPVTYTH